LIRIARVRHVSTLSILLLVVTFAACGGSDSNEDRTVATSPGPTGAAAPGAGSGKDEPPGGRDAGAGSGGAKNEADARFGEQVSFLEKSFFGVRSQVVYFVAGKERPALDQAKQCVQRNLRKAPSAYCFAFPSKRAFLYSRVSPRPPAGMKRPCWNAYWGKPRDRRPLGSASNPAAPALKCPDAAG
jgi:hypothetical protein